MYGTITVLTLIGQNHKETFRYLKFGTWQIDYVVEYSIRMPAIGKKAMQITCQHNCLKHVNLMKSTHSDISLLTKKKICFKETVSVASVSTISMEQ